MHTYSTFTEYKAVQYFTHLSESGVWPHHPDQMHEGSDPLWRVGEERKVWERKVGGQERARVFVHTHTPTQTHTPTHARAHTHTRTNTQKHTHVHTNKHTKTHNQSFVSWGLSCSNAVLVCTKEKKNWATQHIHAARIAERLSRAFTASFPVACPRKVSADERFTLPITSWDICRQIDGAYQNVFAFIMYVNKPLANPYDCKHKRAACSSRCVEMVR